MDSENSLLYKLALSMIPGVGPVLGRRIVSYVGSVEGVFRENKLSLARIPGVGRHTSDNILKRQVLERAEKELEYIERNGIKALFYLDEDYPPVLRNFDDAPLVLYVKGDFDFSDKKQKYLSIVGTRKATNYGKTMCRKLISELVEMGYSPAIVSGLAYGIDYCAHEAALDSGLLTIAVLGHGLNMIYPAVHRTLAREIVDSGGALITEYPFGTKVDKNMFVRRNRIIAALSEATVVAESGIGGGALITARYANDYNKLVAAFPGRSIDEHSLGCNYLIKTNQAVLIDSAEDLIKELNWDIQPVQQKIEFSPVELSDDEQKIVDLLREAEKMHVDNLALELGLSASQLLVVMFNLEMKGVVEQLPGNFYTLKYFPH